MQIIYTTKFCSQQQLVLPLRIRTASDTGQKSELATEHINNKRRVCTSAALELVTE
jgi:hypothetical protein